jgi:nucleotide-binding universal stress UspA family protein
MPRLADPDPGGGSIVVGLGRSPASERALQVTADLAARMGARVHVVHVLDLDDHPTDPDRPAWEDQVRRRLTEERELAAAVVGRQVDGWTYRLMRGDPTTALLAVAEEVDALMLVVGGTRQGWGDHLLHPNARTAGQKLILRSGRPVLVVPSPATVASRTVGPPKRIPAEVASAGGDHPLLPLAGR